MEEHMARGATSADETMQLRTFWFMHLSVGSYPSIVHRISLEVSGEWPHKINLLASGPSVHPSSWSLEACDQTR